MYALLKDGAIDKYPYSFSDLKLAHPRTSFPTSALENESIRVEYNIVEVKEVTPAKQDGHTLNQLAPALVGDEWQQQWEHVEIDYDKRRLAEYGSPESQIEFITENGLEAWQAKVAEIKSNHPKPAT